MATSDTRSSDDPVIAVDAMGGDDAPGAIVRGAAEASLTTGAQILVVGDRDRILAELRQVPHDETRLDVHSAESAISMEASPREALLARPDASLPVAARLVAQDGGPEALVTAGNTGAAVLACAQNFSMLAGVRRAALAAVIPTARRRGEKRDPFALLLDAGATVRVRAEDLVAFGLMGTAYARVVSTNDHPQVALLSNGTEANKGPPEVVEAHRMLKDDPRVRFVGNVEPIHLPQGVADVVVCDGFTGNITLKMLEGVSETMMGLAHYAYRSRFTWRMALWLLRSGINRLKEVTDWQQYGGAPVLGFDRLCIKAHGRSGPRAIRNAIRVAERCCRDKLVQSIADDLAKNGPAAAVSKD